jgi:ATP-dependent helicase HrpB
MVLKGKALGWGGLACELAAILSERDPLRSPGGSNPADVHARLELLRSNGSEAQRRTRLMRAVANDLKRSAGVDRDRETGEEGVLLGFAYPDRIAQRREGDTPRYVLANGRGALLQEGDSLSRAPFLAVALLDGMAREARIFMAGRLSKQDIEEHFSDRINEAESVSWDEANGAVLARRQKRLGALVLEDAPAKSVSPEAIAQALLEAVRARGLDVLPWTPGLRNLQARLGFLRRVAGPEWPDVSDAALLAGLDSWLPPWFQGMSRLSHLQRLPLSDALMGLMDHKQRRLLEEQAPTHVTVPSGSSIRVDYTEGDIPVLRVKLQEMFGQADTPRLAGGKVPVMLHLLSPAQRPMQVTQDLKGFWQRTWPEVKKELKGRYPRHQWPEDPTAAVPSRTGRKPRGT